MNPLYSTSNLTLHYANSRSSSLWGKMSRDHLISLAAAVVPIYSPLSYVLLLIISKSYQVKSMKVTLHSHHTPSELRSWIHALTGQHQDASDQSSFCGGYNNCTYSNRHLSNRYCCLLANGYEMFHLIPVSTDWTSTFWMERPSKTCRVSFRNKINLIHWCI